MLTSHHAELCSFIVPSASMGHGTLPSCSLEEGRLPRIMRNNTILSTRREYERYVILIYCSFTLPRLATPRHATPRHAAAPLAMMTACKLRVITTTPSRLTAHGE